MGCISSSRHFGDGYGRASSASISVTMNADASLLFLTERENYARLSGMNVKELRKFVARIAAQLFIMYEELSDAWVEAHDGKDSLFTDEAQAHLYGHVSGVARLINDEWWINQFKAERMRWHESLLIAGIERYAASEGDVGMFITLTAPSKYHPTRQVGKGESKTAQLNHGWNDEAYTPKDTQRYLCHIWSLMRTAFKDNDLQVYGMRVVEPHHDGTSHWHMMLFCKPGQRKEITDIMRRYALKEDGDERGAAEQRFQAKHLNQGGAASYIAKYIAKNIDGYALDGQLDHDTGKPLQDTAAAVTAWASTWRIPQFKPIGLPTMGAYRELRKLPRGVSIASEFDERVEAARAAADEGEFDFYIAAQGGANVPRDSQIVRVARNVTDEVNDYEEDIERIVGIYAPHIGANHIHTIRSADWRIVPKLLAVEPLTLKSGITAPRSPVNNCGKLKVGDDPVMTPTPSEHAAAVLNLVDSGVIGWDDPEVVTVLRGSLKHDMPKPIRQQRSVEPLKPKQIAPSGRMTKAEREQIPRIRFELAQQGITPQRWQLQALARGAAMVFDGQKYSYPAPEDWPGFV